MNDPQIGQIRQIEEEEISRKATVVLSRASGGEVSRPRALVTKHGVEDGQELAHAGRNSHLGRFALSTQLLFEATDHRVALESADGRHV